jgi:GMP synthase (glutamine-hydrolysing)
MRKVLVFQHVAHEILGTLNPLLKAEGFRIRYVNFQRHSDFQANLEGYNGLIVLGGPMGVYEAAQFPHLTHEMKIIEEALKKEIPVLGICLGSQLLAEVLGGKVRKSKQQEIGWYDVKLTEKGMCHQHFKGFSETEKIFQLHGDTYDVPKGAEHLASSEMCEAQAFQMGKAYGYQFHLEVDEAMIHRWLKIPANKKDLDDSKGKFTEEKILSDTHKFIKRSLELSRASFGAFVDSFGKKEKKVALGSGHGKSKH